MSPWNREESDTTESLFLTWLPFFFGCVIMALKIYSLNLSPVFNTVFLTIIILLCIS